MTPWKKGSQMATIFDKIEILFSEVMSGTRAHNTNQDVY
jgi:hypothetical protein